MIDAVAITGLEFKAPTCEILRGDLLAETVHDVTQTLADCQQSWADTSCTIMSDRWIDIRNRELINLFVTCLKGMMVLKSIDASKQIKCA
jgi:hypothetical protein